MHSCSNLLRLIKTSTTDLDSIDFKANARHRAIAGWSAGRRIGVEGRTRPTADPALNPNGTVQGLGIAQTAGTRRVEAAIRVGDSVIKQLTSIWSGRYDTTPISAARYPEGGIQVHADRRSSEFVEPIIADSARRHSPKTVRALLKGSSPKSCRLRLHQSQYGLLLCRIRSASSRWPDPNIKPGEIDSFTGGIILQPIKESALRWTSTPSRRRT